MTYGIAVYSVYSGFWKVWGERERAREGERERLDGRGQGLRVAGVELRTTRCQGFRLAEGIQGLVHCSPCSKKVQC